MTDQECDDMDQGGSSGGGSDQGGGSGVARAEPRRWRLRAGGRHPAVHRPQARGAALMAAPAGGTGGGTGGGSSRAARPAATWAARAGARPGRLVRRRHGGLVPGGVSAAAWAAAQAVRKTATRACNCLRDALGRGLQAPALSRPAIDAAHEIGTLSAPSQQRGAYGVRCIRSQLGARQGKPVRSSLGQGAADLSRSSRSWASCWSASSSPFRGSRSAA